MPGITTSPLVRSGTWRFSGSLICRLTTIPSKVATFICKRIQPRYQGRLKPGTSHVNASVGRERLKVLVGSNEADDESGSKLHALQALARDSSAHEPREVLHCGRV